MLIIFRSEWIFSCIGLSRIPFNGCILKGFAENCLNACDVVPGNLPTVNENPLPAMLSWGLHINRIRHSFPALYLLLGGGQKAQTRWHEASAADTGKL